jgi:hypothetical protein
MTDPAPPLADESLVARWRRASEPERAAFVTACEDELRNRLPSVDLFLPLDPLPLFDLGPWPPLDLGALPPLEFGLEPLDLGAEHVTLEPGGRAIDGAVSPRKGGGDGPKDAGT